MPQDVLQRFTILLPAPNSVSNNPVQTLFLQDLIVCWTPGGGESLPQAEHDSDRSAGTVVVEPTPLMPTDDIPPMLLRSVEHSSTLESAEGTPRNLFLPLDPEQPSLLGEDSSVSLVESPCEDMNTDYLPNTAQSLDVVSWDEFSTDVSSTRERK